jgi:hypothetical protein
MTDINPLEARLQAARFLGGTEALEYSLSVVQGILAHQPPPEIETVLNHLINDYQETWTMLNDQRLSYWDQLATTRMEAQFEDNTEGKQL